MTASKRHSINGAKVQGVPMYVCARGRGPWQWRRTVALGACSSCVLVCEVGGLGRWRGCEAHDQGPPSTTEKRQKARQARRIGTED